MTSALENGSRLGSARWRTARPGSPPSSSSKTTAVKAIWLGPGKGTAWVTNSMRLSVPAKSTTGAGQDHRDAADVLVRLRTLLALLPRPDRHAEAAESDGQQRADDRQRDEQL